MIAVTAFADDIRDIKPPVYFPANYAILFIIAAAALIIIALVIGRFIIKNLKKKKIAPHTPPKPAYQVAYEALEALKAKNLPAVGKIKEYYFELSDIARCYIEERFGIRAPEMTTEEFLNCLRASEILSGSHKNLLKEFLGLCDIVKFAKYGPNRKEIDSSFDAAKKFVDETKNTKGELEEVAAG